MSEINLVLNWCMHRNGKRDARSSDWIICNTILLLHGIRNYTVYEEKVK